LDFCYATYKLNAYNSVWFRCLFKGPFAHIVRGGCKRLYAFHWTYRKLWARSAGCRKWV